MKRILLSTVLFLISLTPAFAQDLYVCDATGNDANSGTFEAPFKTLSAAVEKCREIRMNNNGEEINVYIKEGRYINTKGAVLDLSAISDGERISFKAYNGEKVTLSGGNYLDSGFAGQVSDEKVRSRIPDDVLNNISEFDISGLAITNYGALSKRGYDSNAATAAEIEVFLGEEWITKASYPNEGYTYSGYTSFYDSEEPVAGKYAIQCYKNRPLEWLHDGKFLEGNAIVEFFNNDEWGSVSVELKDVDADTGYMLTLNNQNHNLGMGKRFKVINILEELDAPGEYYIDRENHKVYFYPVDKGTYEIMLSRAPHAVVDINSVSDIVLDGLIIEGSRKYGIEITDCDNVSVKNCIIRNCGTRLVTSNDTRNVLVDNCDIYNAGMNGILLHGGSDDDFLPANNVISNCRVHDTGRNTATSGSGGAYVNGVGNKITGCTIYNTAGSGMGCNGADSELSYNELYNNCTEMGDMGAIYIGRWLNYYNNTIKGNYIHDIRGYYDRWVHGIYMDDKLCGQIITENIISNVSGIGIKVSGGHDMTVTNNLLYNCEDSIIYYDYSDYSARWDKNLDVTDNVFKRLEANGNLENYLSRYENMSLYYSDTTPTVPKRAKISGNIVYNSRDIVIEPGAKQNSIECDIDAGKDIAIYCFTE